MPRRLILSQRHWGELVRDVLDHPEVETGGLHLGRLIDGDFVACLNVPAGPDAVRTRAGFAPDSDHQQILLNYLWGNFKVDYLGEWHRHPGRFEVPSAHDFRTARQIVESPEWNKTEAVFPIATVQDGRVLLRAFVMRRQGTDFEEIEVQVVPETDPRIQEILLGGQPHHEPSRDNGPSGRLRTAAVPAHDRRVAFRKWLRRCLWHHS